MKNRPPWFIETSWPTFSASCPTAKPRYHGSEGDRVAYKTDQEWSRANRIASKNKDLPPTDKVLFVGVKS